MPASALRNRARAGLPPIPGVYNFNRNTCAAVLRQMRRTKNRESGQDTIVAFLGDSITAAKGGAASTSGGTPANGYDGCHDLSLPARSNAYLNAHGIDSIYANWFGQGTSSTTDADVVSYFGNMSRSGSGWGVSPTVYSIANFVNSQNGGGVADYVSTTTYTCPAGVLTDRAKLYYLTTPTAGMLEVALDGTPQTLINCGVTEAFTTTTYTLGSLATGHTLRIRKDNSGVQPSGGLYFVGCEYWNSTKPQIRIWNWGKGGWSLADQVTSDKVYRAGQVCPTQGQHMTIIALWGNDVPGAPASTTTAIANLNTIIASHQAQGQTVAVVNMQPFDPAGSITKSSSDLYRAAVRAAALAKNCVVIEEDFHHREWTAWNGSGLAWDANHPCGPGYQFKTDMIYGPLLKALWDAA